MEQANKTAKKIIKPQPKQQLFLMCPAYELLFSGSRGSGKSFTLLLDFLQGVEKYGRNWNGIIFRRTYPELEDLIKKSKEIYPHAGGVWKESTKTWYFKNGATLKMRYIDNDNDVVNYQGHEYTWIGFDELGNWSTDYAYITMMACLRSASGVPVRIRASANPGGAGHCVPFGEVLTKQGWKNIKDIGIGDEILSMDDNENYIYQPVLQKFVNDFNGELYHFKSNTTEFVCTPDHKIVRRTETKNKFGRKYHKPSLIEVSKLSKVTKLVRTAKHWEGDGIKWFKVEDVETRKKRFEQPLKLRGDLYVQLMGWYLSEGNCNIRDGEFVISQTKKDGRIKIEKLLKKCKFHYRKNNKGFVVSSKSWTEYLRRFGHAPDKYVPDIIKNTSTKQLWLFFKAIMEGDGNWENNTYYTSSKQLADDMFEIGLKLGYSPRLNIRDRRGIRKFPDYIGRNNCLSYEIRFREGKDAWVEKDKIKKEYYNGKVYALGLPTYHWFFLRQFGKVFLSGNSWIKYRFIDGKEPFKIYKDDETGQTRAYIPALTTDNKILIKNDPNYIKRLKSLPEYLVKAWLYGDWDIFVGQVFDEYDPKIHFIKPIKLGREYIKFCAMDWGYSKPFSIGWYAVSPKGRVYRYREWYGKSNKPNEGLKMPAREVAQRAWEISILEGVTDMVADPSCWNKRGLEGGSVAETFMKVGWNMIRGNNNRIQGWQKVHDLMKLKLEDNLPIFQVFNTCKEFDRIIRIAVADPKKPEDIDTTIEDHLLDEVRYALMSDFVNYSPTDEYGSLEADENEDYNPLED